MASGFDVVMFSGDKLLGGPQLGIVLADSPIIERLGRNPLARALRPDKLSLAALEGTLLDYQEDPLSVPVLRMLSLEASELEARAHELARLLQSHLSDRAHLSVVQGCSSVGGGSAPGQELPTWLVQVQPADGDLDGWGRQLRLGRPPVIVRRAKSALLLDPRTLQEGEAADLAAAFGQIR